MKAGRASIQDHTDDLGRCLVDPREISNVEKLAAQAFPIPTLLSKNNMKAGRASIQDHMDDLGRCLVDLRERRDEVARQVSHEEGERDRLQKDLEVISVRLPKNPSPRRIRSAQIMTAPSKRRRWPTIRSWNLRRRYLRLFGVSPPPSKRNGRRPCQRHIHLRPPVVESTIAAAPTDSLCSHKTIEPCRRNASFEDYGVGLTRK